MGNECTNLLTTEAWGDFEKFGAVRQVANEQLDRGDDVVQLDGRVQDAVGELLVEVEEQLDQGLCGEDGITE